MIDQGSPLTAHPSQLTDIIVIGSGPAGCAAAASCAKAGLHVLMVTEEPEYSHVEDPALEPLESIHPGVSSLLEKIGAAGAEQYASRAFYLGIHAGTNYAPLGEDEDGPWQGMHLNRRMFNGKLVQHIQNLGIAVRFNEKVESFLLDDAKVIGIKIGSTNLFAKYIVDASGKKGVGGKLLQFKRKYFSPPLVCWTGISGNLELFPFDDRAAHFIPSKKGWSWLAPQPPHHCAWTKLSEKGEKDLLPPEELKDFSVIGKVNVANMRWRMFRPVCSEGVILCGDAAGILDPAAGQGIFNALWSGIVAASTVVACLKEPDLASFHLASYDHWFVQQFEMKVQKLRQYYADHGIDIFK